MNAEEYDIFERVDDSALWISSASGLQAVRQAVRELAKTTTNEVFAEDLSTHQIVARANAKSGEPPTTISPFFEL